MTLRAKGSRSITIDGVPYTWSVRGRPSYAQGIGQSNLAVAVQRVDAPQCVLRIVLPVPRPDNWLRLPRHGVKPGDLARWVPMALGRGWSPGTPGPAFELRLTETDLVDQPRFDP
jgi:hypothetical protein